MDHDHWLQLTQEEVLDPGIPICDPHHHLWYNGDDNYSVEEYLRDISEGGHRVVQTVFVESRMMFRTDGPEEMRPVGETEFILNELDRRGNKKGQTDVAAAIIGFVDLQSGARVKKVLEAHIEAGRGRFRGIRNMGTWDASPELQRRSKGRPGLYLDSRFREGFACLRDCGLSFDACMYHPQLPDLIDLAKKFPDTVIVLEHMGVPLSIGIYAGQRESALEDWKRSIAILGTLPNVCLKVGGIGMVYFGHAWQEQAKPPTSSLVAEAMRPYFSWCLDHFGVDRCMFESNFPPDKRSLSYRVIWNAFKRLTQGMSHDERGSLFHDTAARVYRLPNHGLGCA